MKILIIENDKYKYEYLRCVLQKFCNDLIIDRVKSMSKGIKYLNEHNTINNEIDSYDFLICEYILPFFDESVELEVVGEMIINFAKNSCNNKLITILCSDKQKLSESDYQLEFNNLERFYEQLERIINKIEFNCEKVKVFKKIII